MLNGTVGALNIVRIVLLTSIAAVGGAHADFAGARVPAVQVDGKPVLRSQVDAARSRVWVLTEEDLRVFDRATRQEVARVVLPEWVWVGPPRSCAPDLTLGPDGEAYVSSDVVPTLWRVDPTTFAASRLALTLDSDTEKDVGFSALAYSAEQRRLFAVSYLDGSLWRIDPSTGSAQRIPLARRIPKACGLAPRLRIFPQRPDGTLDLCVPAADGPWFIASAPGRGSGGVAVHSCSKD